jgi:hypothetical protein
MTLPSRTQLAATATARGLDRSSPAYRESSAAVNAANGTLNGQSLSAVGIDRKAVALVLANEPFGQLIQKHLPLSDLMLLGLRQAGHDEPVADVDIELVPGSPTGGMQVSRVHRPFA